MHGNLNELEARWLQNFLCINPGLSSHRFERHVIELCSYKVIRHKLNTIFVELTRYMFSWLSLLNTTVLNVCCFLLLLMCSMFISLWRYVFQCFPCGGKRAVALICYPCQTGFKAMTNHLQCGCTNQPNDMHNLTSNHTHATWSKHIKANNIQDVHTRAPDINT